MDKIQKVLIKEGRKDLAEEYYEKIAGFDKWAAFPKVFLELDTQSKKQISGQYGIGPKSEISEIQLSKATRKPYSEELLVYTNYTLSEKQQKDAQNDLEKEKKELEKDSKYQDIRGSRAGDAMYKEKIEKAEAIIKKKYKPMEHPVAWGIGTYFHVNQNMFRYYYGGRRGMTSSAPSNRKQLIEYIKEAKGKVFHVAPDPDVAAKRKERGKGKYDDPTKDAFNNRAKAFAEIKKKQLSGVVDKYVMGQTKIIQKNLTSLSDKIKKGDIYSSDKIDKEVMRGIDNKMLGALGEVFWKMNSVSYIYDSKSLSRFVKEINAVANKIK